MKTKPVFCHFCHLAKGKPFWSDMGCLNSETLHWLLFAVTIKKLSPSCSCFSLPKAWMGKIVSEGLGAGSNSVLLNTKWTKCLHRCMRELVGLDYLLGFWGGLTCPVVSTPPLPPNFKLVFSSAIFILFPVLKELQRFLTNMCMSSYEHPAICCS